MALSLPTVVGQDGGVQVLAPAMDVAEAEAERLALMASARVFRGALASLTAI